MRLPRRPGAVLGALSVLALSSCMDSNVTSPEVDVTVDPAFAVYDGSTSGDTTFYFLTPLADGTPDINGTFNPLLFPEMQVCVIDESQLGLPANPDDKTSCAENTLVLEPGALPVTVDEEKEQYKINWDTDGPETGSFDTEQFLLLEILLGDHVVGWIDLDPQDPDGPGESDADAYAFRLGATIPVKFWLSEEVLCDTSAYVTECVTGAVVDQSGANLSLEDEGNKLGVIVFENSLPEPFDQVLLTLERIDPALFLAATGEECIPGVAGVPGFDAPQFGDCFRLTTTPELNTELLTDALISICLDVSQLGLTDEQLDQLTMTRYNDSGATPIWEGLPDVAGDCPIQTASLLDVPDTGLMRYAAMGLNAVADFLGPEPLAAGDISLGGLSSSFSRFRYARPGQMAFTEGDGTEIQSGDDNAVPVTVTVLDYKSLPVAGATVHFSSSDGTLSASQAVTDGNGDATITWTVDVSAAGDKTLTASALGLLSGPVPEHTSLDDFFYTTESVTATVTVVGPPSALSQSPSSNIDAVAGEAETLSVTVTDEFGNLVAGTDVIWTCSPDCYFNGDPSTTQNADGSATFTGATDGEGVATVAWTPLTSGSQVSVATVGTLTANFTATVAPAAAVEPTWPTPPSTGTAGLTLDDPLVVTVTDEFGNAREGDTVEWTVASGGGSVSATSTTVGADGTTQVIWTLGQTAGTNTLAVALAGTSFSTTLTVEGVAGDPVQPTGTGSGQTGTVGEALTSPLTVTLLDQFDNPIGGETVTFATLNGGSFDPATTTTGADGVASTIWTLGTTDLAGGQSATASVAGFTVGYAADDVPAAPSDLNESPSAPVMALVEGDIPLSIVVEDQYGNAVPSASVTWAVTAGGGFLSGADATTASDGSAGATWTLGSTPGANTATVTVGTVTATFDATAECHDGWGTAQIDGAFGTEWVCANSESFTAKISGGSTPAEVHWMNDGSQLYMAVRVQQSSQDKVNDLRLDFDNDGDGAAAVGDDAMGHEAGAAIDEWLDQKCFDKSQSGCGTTDGINNVSSAVDNDGTWTVFELSTPLADDANSEDFSRIAGDALGFFLSLQQGNGAQGNTQWPGFRDYKIITIVGPPSSE